MLKSTYKSNREQENTNILSFSTEVNLVGSILDVWYNCYEFTYEQFTSKTVLAEALRKLLQRTPIGPLKVLQT